MEDRKEEIIREIQRIAASLGKDSLTQHEFKQNSEVSLTTVRYNFGSWNRAIEAAGLAKTTRRWGDSIISDDELLGEILRLTEELGKSPSEAEMSALGRFSLSPYRDRWGRFSEAVRAANAKRVGQSSLPEIAASSSLPHAEASKEDDSPPKPYASTKNQSGRRKIQYGEPIDFRGLRHAPVNEQGVVYVFGMVSRELGFLIESIRTAYPDCEGKRCVDEKRQLWENVLIEFEFRISNFLEHAHNPTECDLIVCWIHDWPDCPLEILELRSALNSLH